MATSTDRAGESGSTPEMSAGGGGGGGSSGSRTRPAAVLPGFIAGLIETVAVQPIDLVKTRFQISERPNPSLLRGFRDVYREGGVLRFYRGIVPEMASTAPARTAMYAGMVWTQHMIEILESETKCRLTGPRQLKGEIFVAGVASGVPEALVVTPLQLVKVRLQSKEHLGRYKHAGHCVWTIMREEGALALMTGLRATVWRNCIFNGVYFWSQAHLKTALGNACGDQSGAPNGDHLTAALKTSGCAFVAASFATCFNAPFDMAKSRIQQQVTPGHKPAPLAAGPSAAAAATADAAPAVLAAEAAAVTTALRGGPCSLALQAPPLCRGVAASAAAAPSPSPQPPPSSALKYRTTFQTLGLIWKEEGYRALYKGLAPKMLRMATGAAVGMASFETVQRLCHATD